MTQPARPVNGQTLPATATLASPARWLRPASPFGLLAVAWAAVAGPLADPTRPPAALAAVEPAAAATAPAGRRAPVVPAVPVPPPPPPLPLLQSVHLPAQGPAQALVNGQLVKVGESVAGRRVLAIDSQGLLLQADTGTERLTLLGGTPKQAAGSILTTHSARFTPAPAVGNPAAPAGELDPQPRAERMARPEPAQALPPRLVNTGPLSVAGKTPP